MSTEHILLALLEEATGPMAELMSELPLSEPAIEPHLEFEVPEEPAPPDIAALVANKKKFKEFFEQLSLYTKELVSAVQLAAKEAAHRKGSLTPELLFYAICLSQDSRAREALRRAGYDPDYIAGKIRAVA